MELKDRIATVIQVNQHTAASFADLLGVQRSTISHVLNGRNKPSIDFIEKVIAHFPRVDPGWLITGKSPDSKKKEVPAEILKPETTQKQSLPSSKQKRPTSDRYIKKIVIFYSDQTFETYEQANA